MMHSFSHRGPDGEGCHVSGAIGLGHKRLAIIDVEAGQQPISNEDGTIWLVYNGEVYNFQELRDELISQGHQFRTNSDTEVIVHLYEQHGVACLSRLRGMFAFALWDDRTKSLFLARDRVGIKPLYYCNTGKAIVFGSEIKALLADPDVRREIDLQAIDKFITHFCLPGNETLWKGIVKLEPGCYMLVRDGQVRIERYWDLEFRKDRRWTSFEEAADAVYSLTRSTVREHMISDVPVGFLSSGGVDSTAVLSCAASETGRRIQTFTVGFDKADFEDERPYARMAAQWFGTEHHEITFSPKEFWDFLPSLAWHMEEPVCDPPSVSLHYVSKLARQSVTVLLSGEGGDEAFGGYHSYRKFLLIERAKSISKSLGDLPRMALQRIARLVPESKLAKLSRMCELLPPEYYYSRVASPFEYFNKTKPALYTADFAAAVATEKSLQPIRDLHRRVEKETLLHRMQYIDTKTSLPEDLLIKADRITMANSLELRVPFLDHQLLEMAASLPPEFKVKGGATKRILKKAFQSRIPDRIIRRKKAGFPLPLSRWLREELKGPVSDLLLGAKSLSRGYFSRSGIERILSLHESGKPLAKEIFSLLTLELVQQQFLDCPR